MSGFHRGRDELTFTNKPDTEKSLAFEKTSSYREIGTESINLS